MFCENCGNKNDGSDKFCTKCGHSAVSSDIASGVNKNLMPTLNEKWWHRFAKVIYIVLYIPLPFLLVLVWDENSGYYGSTGESFWFTLLTFIVYVAVVKLIKIAFLYIAFAQKPQWKKEFKKLF